MTTLKLLLLVLFAVVLAPLALLGMSLLPLLDLRPLTEGAR